MKVLWFTGLLLLLGSLSQAAERPNVVVILLDDMGYSDIGCYGSEIPTPNIDALAEGGMRFRWFYNCAQCCPTRASLLTGMYPHQVGVGDMIDRHSLAVRKAADSPHYQDHLTPNAKTIAEWLRPLGYQTYMTGKWHLGYDEGQRPLQRGFDRYYGIIAGADSYWRPRSLREGDTPVDPKTLPKDFYATDTFTTKAMEFIEQGDADKPFFLYLAYNAVHAPFHAPDAEIAKHEGNYAVGWETIRQRRFARQKDLGFWPPETELSPRDPSSSAWTGSQGQLALAERMEKYAGMMSSLDANVGRLVKFLQNREELDDTLILFLNDNGAWASGATYGQEWAETGDTPFRLFKLFTHEGGICTPLIAHWPRQIPANTLNTMQYAHVKDILPTILEVVAAPEQSKLAGKSFLPALKQPEYADNETLYWERMGHCAIREGDWKLVRAYNANRTYNKEPSKRVAFGARTGKWELYNLQEDPSETQNLAPSMPQKVQALSRKYQAWADAVGVVPREVIVERIITQGLTNE